MNDRTPQRAGFTFVEALVVTLLASLIMMAFQGFYTQMVRSSLKGDDSLDSFRAAHRLFLAIQKDLESFNDISTTAVTTVPAGSNLLPATTVFASSLIINGKNNKIAYNLTGTPGKQTVERVETSTQNNSTQKKLFGVSRIRGFEVAYIKKNELVGNSPKVFAQVLISVVVQSENAMFPTEEVKMTTTFFPEHLSASDWNYPMDLYY